LIAATVTTCDKLSNLGIPAAGSSAVLGHTIVVTLLDLIGVLFRTAPAILAGKQIKETCTPDISSNPITNKKSCYCAEGHTCLQASSPKTVNEKNNEQSNSKKSNEDPKNIPKGLTIWLVRFD